MGRVSRIVLFLGVIFFFRIIKLFIIYLRKSLVVIVVLVKVVGVEVFFGSIIYVVLVVELFSRVRWYVVYWFY